MTPELCAEERCRILRERISALNANLSMTLEERLDALHDARMALKKAEKDLYLARGYSEMGGITNLMRGQHGK